MEGAIARGNTKEGAIARGNTKEVGGAMWDRKLKKQLKGKCLGICGTGVCM